MNDHDGLSTTKGITPWKTTQFCGKATRSPHPLNGSIVSTAGTVDDPRGQKHAVTSNINGLSTIHRSYKSNHQICLFLTLKNNISKREVQS